MPKARNEWDNLENSPHITILSSSSYPVFFCHNFAIFFRRKAMKFLPRLRFRNHRDFNPDQSPHPIATEASHDDGLISLSNGSGAGGIFEDEDDYITAASSSSSSSWSCSSQGTVRRDEITISGERNEETEDTASSVRGRMTPVDGENSKEASINVVAAEGKRSSDSPPTDDCCPICFSGFSVPVRAPCGHWYCGSCILQYWEYGPAIQPCKCPMCSQKINNLTPEASLGTKHEPEAAQVLSNVRRYNRLFVGGPYGIILKLLELPLCIKRVFYDMLNPDRPGAHLNKLRAIAILLGFLYTFCPLDFLHIGRQNVVDLFDFSAMALSLVFYISGLFLQRRRFQRVREMAAVEL